MEWISENGKYEMVSVEANDDWTAQTFRIKDTTTGKHTTYEANYMENEDRSYFGCQPTGKTNFANYVRYQLADKAEKNHMIRMMFSK